MLQYQITIATPRLLETDTKIIRVWADSRNWKDTITKIQNELTGSEYIHDVLVKVSREWCLVWHFAPSNSEFMEILTSLTRFMIE